MAKKTVDQMADQMDISEKEAGGLMVRARRLNNMARYMRGGHVCAIIYGGSDAPVEWGREELKGDTEELIQGTESQVRGRYFNNNDGKGTF
jgi:hypothetical protein|tara:strand:- start:106 stop:378 length:273 start_codon:yes stop_codon:yes gene_type:complete